MLSYKNLTIIGTSHIAVESVKKVEETILRQKPSVVAIELDRNRLHALKNRQKRNFSFSDITRVGFTGFLFALIGSYVQKKLGKIVDMEPGDEMLRAADAASRVNAKIALIDRDIGITLQRLSKFFSFREKMRAAGEIFKFIFFRKKAMKEFGIDVAKMDLTKVPSQDIIEKLMKMLEKKYPNIYRVIITERNYFMAKRLIRLMKNDENGRIIAVVGAGHSDGLIKDIKNNINKLDII